ncbi:MAG TPA: alpha/beta fold hydrolase [Thermoanaerobaculia bacterium]|nr:alpha/beta fold hydrolase [Thermoanaerobaculia bacterium]
MPRRSDLTLPARDGFPLRATLFTPDSPPRASALLAGGMGIPRRFYARLAEDLAANGFAALTLDYRGMGESVSGPIRALDASITTWATQDLAAALDWIRRELSPRAFLVGHSAGGQMVGLVPEAESLEGVVLVTAQSGYWGHWPFPIRYLYGALWYGLMPAATRAFGFFPARALGLGENLPAGAAREWASWCRSPGYLFDEIEPADLARYERFDRPILAWSFTDDAYAPPAAVDALLAGFLSAPIEHRRVDPSAAGLPRVGHLGFFRESSRESLWRATIEWMASR